MPIDHPSDLPDDADRADEWRAAEDSQAPGGRRPSPPEQAAEQSLPSADGRPDDRSQASSDAPAAGSERLNPGDQQGDDERRAPDRQAADGPAHLSRQRSSRTPVPTNDGAPAANPVRMRLPPTRNGQAQMGARPLRYSPAQASDQLRTNILICTRKRPMMPTVATAGPPHLSRTPHPNPGHGRNTPKPFQWRYLAAA